MREELLGRVGSRTELFFRSYARAPLPLWQVKRLLNRRALGLLPRVYPRMSSAGGLLEVLAWANRVDFGLPWQPRDPFAGALVRVEHGAVEALEGAGSVAILLDNAGEAVFDVAAALRLASQGYRVALVARWWEYEVDVTAWEARRLLRRVGEVLGLDARGVEVLAVKARLPAPALEGYASRLAGEFDLVVSKGIANMEALMEYCMIPPGKVLVALAAKCPPFSAELGVPLGGAVARMGYRCVGRARTR